MTWIAEQALTIVKAHQDGADLKNSKCEGCDQFSLVIIRTAAGQFCDECIEEMTNRLEEARELVRNS